MADKVDKFVRPETGKQFHTAIHYGVTQACLDAVAKSQHKLMAQVIAKEYGTTISDKMIPIFTQSGDDRYTNADKMIMKGAECFLTPCCTMEQRLVSGVKLRAYVEWLRNRVIEKRTSQSYNPIFHIDVWHAGTSIQ